MYKGRSFTLIKRTLANFPTYYMFLLTIPMSIAKTLESIQCKFFLKIWENRLGIKLKTNASESVRVKIFYRDKLGVVGYVALAVHKRKQHCMAEGNRSEVWYVDRGWYSRILSRPHGKGIWEWINFKNASGRGLVMEKESVFGWTLP